MILNYKVKEQALKCIDSVKKSTFKNLDIILVDNNSEDGIGEEFKDDREVTFIQNSVNSGYSGGNNLGIGEALRIKDDYIFVLNPDTTIEKDTIGNLVEGMEKLGADLASPKIYFASDSEQKSSAHFAKSKRIWYAGSNFDFANVLGQHRGVNEEDKGQYNEPVETEGITGGAFMAKESVFDKIGLFDGRYFLYYEDADLSLRAKKAGFKIMYIPSAVVFHKNAQSTGLGSPLQDYFITRNRMLFAKKFLPFRTRFALLREALRNLGNPMRRLALWDFLAGNFGRGGFRG